MEKLINRRLRWILKTMWYPLAKADSGKCTCSTIDQLINIEINICDEFITNQSTVMVALGLEKKAYDMVCRQRLISNLKIVGL